MKYILLIVTMINGQYETFEHDFNLSREDCAQYIAIGVEQVEWDGEIILLDEQNTTYICEILPLGGL